MATQRSSSDPAFLAAFGDSVRLRREELGMDRRELSESAKISYSYLSAIESGQKLPSGTYQEMLAEALQLEPHDLLALANSEPSPLSDRIRPSGADDSIDRFAAMTSRGVSASGAIAELDALATSLSPEDLSLVLSMARRLSVAGGQERSRIRREREYRGRSGRESRTEAYLRFWQMYFDAVDARGLDWVRGRTPEPRSYFTSPSPVRGSSISASFARNRLLRHELYINRGSREANLDLLHDLEAERDVLETAYGGSLEFEDPGRERRAVRVAEYREGHISRGDEFEEYVNWFIDRGISLRSALGGYTES